MAAGVGAKAVPRLVVGALIPAICFLVGHRLWGLWGAVLLTLSWNLSCQIARFLRGRPLSGLLGLGLFELLARATVALSLNSTRMYFIAPAIVTALTGFVYLLSGSGARSLTSRLLEEMLPEDVIDVGNPRVKRLVRVGAQIYGLEQIVTAALTVLLVVNVSTTTFLAVHPFLSWAVLGVAIALGTVLFRLDERRQPGNGRSVATLNFVPRLLTGAPA